jgi:hypothetical protein
MRIRDSQRLDPDSLRGIVPQDWLNQRQIIGVRLDPDLQFVDLMDARTVHRMRRALASVASAENLEDIDLGAMVGPQRRVTQAVSRYVYEQTRGGSPQYAGIRYVSRLGLDWECWAVFDGRIRHLGEVMSKPLIRNRFDDLPILYWPGAHWARRVACVRSRCAGGVNRVRFTAISYDC